MDIQATKLELMQLLLQTNEEGVLKKVLKLFKNIDTKKNNEIPNWQIEESVKRLESLKKGDLKTRNWEEAKTDIFS